MRSAFGDSSMSKQGLTRQSRVFTARSKPALRWQAKIPPKEMFTCLARHTLATSRLLDMDTGSAWRMAWHEPDQPACCEKGRCPMSSRQARVPAAQEARASGSLRREQPWAAAAAEARGAGTRGEPRRACPRRKREQPWAGSSRASLRRRKPWERGSAEACGASSPGAQRPRKPAARA